MRFALLPLTLCFISASFSAQAKVYKWIDEDGQMHFGDKIPARYLVKAHDELNEQGVVTSHRAAAKTPAEKAEEKRIAKEKEKAVLAEKKKIQRDRVLLDTYTTEADLIAARDSRLEAVDTQIQLAKSIISESNEKIGTLEMNVAQIKLTKRVVPKDTYKRINSQRHQVEIHGDVMQKHIKRREGIVVQFDGYLERFRVLKAEQKARRERIARERVTQY